MAPVRKTTVLFVCTGNACRSQMAEGWTRHLKGDAVEASSAGVLAAGLDALAVKVMAEAGVDISTQRSKTTAEFAGQTFDCVVTLCDYARGSCPFFPGAAKHLHRGFDDPRSLAMNAASEEDALGVYRRIRDEIRGFVEKMPESLEEDDCGPGEDIAPGRRP